VKDALADDLTYMNIMLLYDLMNPIDYSNMTAVSVTGREEAALSRFRSDTIFKTRVQCTVAHLMVVIDKHCDIKE
jgi:hypothetical protein